MLKDKIQEHLYKSAEAVGGRTFSKTRHQETIWWNERIAEAVKRKTTVWREWFKNRTEENKDKWKRLSKAIK